MPWRKQVQEQGPSLRVFAIDIRSLLLSTNVVEKLVQTSNIKPGECTLNKAYYNEVVLLAMQVATSCSLCNPKFSEMNHPESGSYVVQDVYNRTSNSEIFLLKLV